MILESLCTIFKVWRKGKGNGGEGGLKGNAVIAGN